MKRIALLGILALLIAGCAAQRHLGPAVQVAPEAVGSNVSLVSLQSDIERQSIFYSGPVYNPSAVLFIPEGTPAKLRPKAGWAQIDSSAELKKVLDRIETHRPKLSALIAPGAAAEEGAAVWAYVYSPETVTLERQPNSDLYLVEPVSELFNPVYHGR
jgi:hypothetical protein